MKKNEYDVIIIGAGIGGLVCGCYLAKRSLKVLILEKNNIPGGYCVSFEKDDFLFDACVHTLGSCRRNGILYNILNDFDLLEELKIEHFNPSDVIVAPDFKVSFYHELQRTIESFSMSFPKERKNLKLFFNYISTTNFAMLIERLKEKSFKNLLDEFFSDVKLKSLLSLPLLGNAGLPASLISASTAVIIFREFILDGGYCLEKGIGNLAIKLERKFVSFGGQIRCSRVARKIKIKNRKIKEIVLQDKTSISTKIVISNIDMHYNFFKLLGRAQNNFFHETFKNMKPSLSAFTIFMGQGEHMSGSECKNVNLWILPSYDVEHNYKLIKNGDIQSKDVYSLCFFRSGFKKLDLSSKKSTLSIFVNAPFRSKTYWRNERTEKAKKIIRKLNNYFSCTSAFSIKSISDPTTLYEFTANYRGAAFGWAPYVAQARSPFSNKISCSNGIYFIGHWTGQGHGVATVAYLGKKMANSIMKNN